MLKFQKKLMDRMDANRDDRAVVRMDDADEYAAAKDIVRRRIAFRVSQNSETRCVVIEKF